MKSVNIKKIQSNLRLVAMVLVFGVILQAASAAARDNVEGIDGVEPVSLNASIQLIDLRGGYFIVGEEEIILDRAGSLANLLDLNGNKIRLESFKTGEYVLITGGRFPNGKIYAFEIRKVKR